MEITRKKIQERYYPLPKGNLTRQQRLYQERMLAVQACAFYDGYKMAKKDAEEETEKLRREIYQLRIDNVNINSNE